MNTAELLSTLAQMSQAATTSTPNNDDMNRGRYVLGDRVELTGNGRTGNDVIRRPHGWVEGVEDGQLEQAADANRAGSANLVVGRR